MPYPDNRAAHDYAFRLDTSLFQTLAIRNGWRGTVPPADVRGNTGLVFGWGARVLVKDWEDQTFRVITLSNRAVGLLASPILTVGLVHRMPTGALPYTGSGASALYKRHGFGKRIGPKKSNAPQTNEGETKGDAEAGP